MFPNGKPRIEFQNEDDRVWWWMHLKTKTREAESKPISVSLRSAWSPWWVSGQLGLQRETLSPPKKNKTKHKIKWKRFLKGLTWLKKWSHQGTTVDLQDSRDKDMPYVPSKTNSAETKWEAHRTLPEEGQTATPSKSWRPTVADTEGYDCPNCWSKTQIQQKHRSDARVSKSERAGDEYRTPEIWNGREFPEITQRERDHQA